MKKEKVKSIISEIELNRNHSWYVELWERNKNSLRDTALFYRETEITYHHMFRNMRLLASAMRKSGIRKGTEIPVCMSNSPELIYVMGAASLLGAKINVFGAKFPPDYVKEIIDGCDSPIGFFEDNHFAKLRQAVEKSHLNEYILCSLQDSLKSDLDPNMVQGNEMVCFMSSVSKWKTGHDHVVSFSEFLQREEGIECQPDDSITLEDEFSITYTSGSTNALRPKAIVQRVRSFCVIGRFHDPDLMYGMKFKNIRGLAIIPPYSNTDLISSISDTLMQGAVLTLEPVYDENFFLDSLILNRPNYVIGTRSFWITAMKRCMTVSVKLPFLLLVFAVGEELSINEEKYLNRMLRKVDAGRDNLHISHSPISFCVAGGDCEHGSILYRLFRAATNFSLDPTPEKRYGMTPFDFVDVAVLDQDGNKLGPNQVGRLVADSPCTMKCYKNDPVAKICDK